MGRKTLSYEQYIASDLWKCGDSPTTAHHWVEIQTDEELHTGRWYCKYCMDVKLFPKNWSACYRMYMEED